MSAARQLLTRASDTEIRDLLYIRDDRAIAKYLCVDIDRVAKVRAANTAHDARRRDVEQDTQQGVDTRPLNDIAAKASSQALLVALLRYGLTHDGLPGLTATMFFKRCRENGVAILR